MNYAEALNFIIDDGIEAARHDYTKPHQREKLQGSINGFENCRFIQNDPLFISNSLNELLIEAEKTTKQKRETSAPDYWFWRCRHAEIEWVCNVFSAILQSNGYRGIVPVTARGMIKAREIVGTKVQ